MEKKPDQKLAVPATLEDLELLLNSYETLNSWYPVIGEIACDDYYVTNASFNSLPERDRNFYLWEKFDDIGSDWNLTYRNIFTTNIILETVDEISNEKNDRKDIIRGSALFIRAFHHFALAQLFCSPYNSSTASSDLGIPLRLKSEIAIKPTRSSVEETYSSVLNDLENAVKYLPTYSTVKYLPSKSAAYGLLSRVFLSMRNYEKAGLYADSTLKLYSTLIDYNTINSSQTIPFKQFNEEVIYDAKSFASTIMLQTRAKVDTLLYSLYDSVDLRKTVFFRSFPDNSYSFKGNYTGSSAASLFVGIATDELYLTRAECAARAGDVAMALSDLNTLLENRIESGKFQPLQSDDKNKVLEWILEERRKELVFRTIRWTDLRRLNLEENFSTEIYRYINEQEHVLLPNAARYVFQIDGKSVITSGLKQNP